MTRHGQDDGWTGCDIESHRPRSGVYLPHVHTGEMPFFGVWSSPQKPRFYGISASKRNVAGSIPAWGTNRKNFNVQAPNSHLWSFAFEVFRRMVFRSTRRMLAVRTTPKQD